MIRLRNSVLIATVAVFAACDGYDDPPALTCADWGYENDNGPAEWAVERREHFRREAVEAATIVAEDALASGDLEEAIRVCRRGLELDRFHDPLWRVLIAARDQAGDPGAASRDRREYASILEGLGVSPELAANSA